jgi:UDP-glucose 4-epimerase
MSENIFRACKETNVPRLIVASSVHCHNIKYLENANYTNYINIKTPTNPSSFYGKDKFKIEDLGKNYSKFYGVVCIRFGGIEKVDMCFWKTNLGVTHSDCVGLIEHIINLETIKTKFQKIYGLSKSDNSVFNLKNNLNWEPKDDLTEFYNKHQNFNVK